MTDHLDGLPKSFRVGPHDISFYGRDELKYENSECWGLYTHPLMIEIQTNIPTKILAVDTVLHELGHAIYKIYGMGGDDEERAVTGFASGLTQVFRDNPRLLTWIARRLK